MSLILIAAVDENRVIGNKGEIPWNISEDFKRFKKLTLNHPVIMGRSTYESILKRIGKPLDKRENIIVSRRGGFFSDYPNVHVCGSIEEALALGRPLFRDCYLAGGQSIYEQTISRADRLEITEVHKKYDGDAFFPEIDKKKWKEATREDKIGFSFVSYIRQ